MKAAPLLVSWHNENAPIYSAHFEPHGKGRLATAGGDNNVRVGVWKPLRRCAAVDKRIALEG
jgi:chromatin assembly factor 1 subunit B